MISVWHKLPYLVSRGPITVCGGLGHPAGGQFKAGRDAPTCFTNTIVFCPAIGCPFKLTLSLFPYHGSNSHGQASRPDQYEAGAERVFGVRSVPCLTSPLFTHKVFMSRKTSASPSLPVQVVA